MNKLIAALGGGIQGENNSKDSKPSLGAKGNVHGENRGSQKDAGPDRARRRIKSEQKLLNITKTQKVVSKIVKRSASICDLITDDDTIETMRVIREAKNATSRFYDVNAKHIIEQPDSKTRLAAATLELAYSQGLPVQRSIQLTGNFNSAEDVVQALGTSDEAQKALKALSGLGITLEMDGEVIDLENRENSPPDYASDS